MTLAFLFYHVHNPGHQVPAKRRENRESGADPERAQRCKADASFSCH